MWINTAVLLSSLPLIAVSGKAAAIAFIAGTLSTAVRMAFER